MGPPDPRLPSIRRERHREQRRAPRRRWPTGATHRVPCRGARFRAARWRLSGPRMLRMPKLGAATSGRVGMAGTAYIDAA
jgi:hypothetical protein